MIKSKYIRILPLIMLFFVMFISSCSEPKSDSGISRHSYTQTSDDYTESEDSASESSLFPDSDGEFSAIAKRDELPSYIKENPNFYTAQLSNILKLYYTGIVNGRINSESFTPKKSDDILPSKGDTAEKRKESADFCTIGGALEYYSLDDKNTDWCELYNGCLPYFCNDKQGDIYLSENISSDSVWQLTNYKEPLSYIFKFCNIDELETDAMTFVASELNGACKTYYEGIKNRSIKKGSFTQKYTHDTLPDEYTTPEPAFGLANHATLGGAAEYIGKYRQYIVCIKKLGTDNAHNIYPMSDSLNRELHILRSSKITMAELYGIS